MPGSYEIAILLRMPRWIYLKITDQSLSARTLTVAEQLAEEAEIEEPEGQFEDLHIFECPEWYDTTVENMESVVDFATDPLKPFDEEIYNTNPIISELRLESMVSDYSQDSNSIEFVLKAFDAKGIPVEVQDQEVTINISGPAELKDIQDLTQIFLVLKSNLMTIGYQFQFKPLDLDL